MRRTSSMLAIAIYTLFALLSAELGVVVGRPIALLGLLSVPVAVIGIWPSVSRPTLSLAAMVAGGSFFRLAIAYAGPMTDQIETTQAAWRAVLAGSSPYGAALSGTSTGAPFPYGPLAIVAYIPGVWTEIVAAALVMFILARHRSWLVLAVYSACPLTVRGTVMGLNDVLPGLLILVAILEARRSPARAAAVLAVATAIKPYAAAWIPGLVGMGGLGAAAWFGGVSILLWSPVLLVWGVPAFLRSLQLAEEVHTESYAALNAPVLRLVAAPLAAAGLLVRSWRPMAWLGVAIFLAVLFLARWASLGYLLAVLPIAGLLLESGETERRGAGKASDAYEAEPTVVPASPQPAPGRTD